MRIGKAIVTNPPIASAIKITGRNTNVNSTFVIPQVILNASPISFPKIPNIRQININVNIILHALFLYIDIFLVSLGTFRTIDYVLIKDKSFSYNITFESFVCIQIFIIHQYSFIRPQIQESSLYDYSH